jgi:ABC-2 type transport system ATP-binding protein
VTPAIEFVGVSKTYQKRFRNLRVAALSEISFEVAGGEICGFLGPNGAGKTTSLNILMGFAHADRGRSRVLGLAPGDVRAKAQIGFLPENFAFYRHLDATDLLRFHLRLSDRRVADSDALIAKLLAKVKLDNYKGLRIGKYSRGMVQRVGIAQALLGDPDLLVLDEPTSGLDPAGRKEVRELLLALKAEGKTIFLSSHILSEIEHVCDRVIIINHGRVVRAGLLREMLDESDRVEILVDRLQQPLEQDVKQLGASVDHQSGNTRIIVDGAQKRRLVEMLWAGGSDVLSLAPLRSSLEEMFLKLVGGPKAE